MYSAWLYLGFFCRPDGVYLEADVSREKLYYKFILAFFPSIGYIYIQLVGAVEMKMISSCGQVVKHTWFFAIAGGFISIIIATPASHASIVGLDGRNGMYDSTIFATGDEYDSFRETITALGHTIVPVYSFETADLVGLDSLILKQPYLENSPAGFSDSEISAIHDFVDTGGGLVVHAEGGTGSEDFVDNLNSLVSRYGVVYADVATANSGVMITGFVAHPVTNSVSMIGVDYQRKLISITSPAMDLTIKSGEYNVLAVVNGIGGAGNVVMLSDTTLWKDPEVGSDYSLITGDNRLLLENIVQFAVPEPTTVSFLCLGSLVLLRKRRRL
jgi:hypothetical protein